MCLALLLTACGDAEDKPPVSEFPEDIEKVYQEALAKMIAKQMSHTEEGPVFTEEELAEFDRLEQQYNAYKEAQKNIARQQKLRAQYQTCVENQDTACPELIGYTLRRDRDDLRMVSLGSHNRLPENITYQHYFGLTGEGCEGDGPVNQWTDADTVTVRYVGEGENVSAETQKMGSRRGQCHIERQVKTPDIVFQSDKNPEVLTFSYQVPPTVDDVLQICRDRDDWRCQGLVKGKDSDVYLPSDGKYKTHAKEVTISNFLPEGIAYQHYFSLSGDCASDGPVGQWTDTSSIVVYFTGESGRLGNNPYKGSCEVGKQLKITGADFIFGLPDYKIYFWHDVFSKRNNSGK